MGSLNMRSGNYLSRGMHADELRDMLQDYVKLHLAKKEGILVLEKQVFWRKAGNSRELQAVQ
jgi:hypothetical protein